MSRGGGEGEPRLCRQVPEDSGSQASVLASSAAAKNSSGDEVRQAEGHSG